MLPACWQSTPAKLLHAVRRFARAPSDEVSAMRRWAVASNGATATRNALAIRSLATLVDKRAARIVDTVKTARFADYRLALRYERSACRYTACSLTASVQIRSRNQRLGTLTDWRRIT